MFLASRSGPGMSLFEHFVNSIDQFSVSQTISRDPLVARMLLCGNLIILNVEICKNFFEKSAELYSNEVSAELRPNFCMKNITPKYYEY